MRCLDAKDAAFFRASCALMTGALVDFRCQEMHLMWWLLCKVQGIIQRYDFAVARYAAALDKYLLTWRSIWDEYLDLEEEEYDEYSRLELAHLMDLERLCEEYQEVVGWIPPEAAENMRIVHDCGMVFQVLLDFPDISFARGRRPFFLRVLRDSVLIPLFVRTSQLFGTRRLWLQISLRNIGPDSCFVHEVHGCFHSVSGSDQSIVWSMSITD